jgi:hypothetical protein
MSMLLVLRFLSLTLLDLLAPVKRRRFPERAKVPFCIEPRQEVERTDVNLARKLVQVLTAHSPRPPFIASGRVGRLGLPAEEQVPH